MLTIDETISFPCRESDLDGIIWPQNNSEQYKQELLMHDASCAWNLLKYQKQLKFYPSHQIARYCLYIGSFVSNEGNYDLYHYRSNDGNYSTAIVYGEDDGSYMSGWPECTVMGEQCYKELMRREDICGLLTNEELAKIGRSFLQQKCKRKE
mgnify:CR=1 FL=1